MKIWIYCFLCADDFGIHFEIDTAGFAYTKTRKEALCHCQIIIAFLLKFLVGIPDDKN